MAMPKRLKLRRTLPPELLSKMHQCLPIMEQIQLIRDVPSRVIVLNNAKRVQRNIREKNQWFHDWRQFLRENGKDKPIIRIPMLSKININMFQFYKLVVKNGGLVEVINKNLWQTIFNDLNLPKTITSFALFLRSLYARYLYDFECHQHNFSTKEDLAAALNGNRQQ